MKKNEINKKIKKGGEVLGKGTFGCVLTPPLKCTNKIIEGKGKVGKIFQEEIDAIEENEISKMIEKIDPNQKFSIYSNNLCNVKFEDIEKSDQFNQCNYPKQKLYYQLHMNKAYELGKFMENNKYNYNFLDYVTHLINLSEGLIKFSYSKLCHSDIKSNNIVISDNTFKFIDFGLSIEYDELYKQLITGFYPIYPPELNIFSNLEIIKDNLKDLLELYEEHLLSKVKFFFNNFNFGKNYKKFLKNLVNGETSEIRSFLKDLKKNKNVKNIDVFSLELIILQFHEKNKKKSLKDLINDKNSKIYLYLKNLNKYKNIEKIDVFSLGLVILQFYENSNKKVEKHQKKLIEEIIINSLAFHYDDRYSSKQLKNKLKELYKTILIN